ncbi:MAG: toll/interleukin-1 receptor domain-containing protein [Cytophagaceae bacterium]|nr:toll/interleukin-1 receptor domain-containing protein [Cytophagaceae bacterium]MBK9935520.1 toll/interleukin-1 receptor domain-containing protein [Cytophagaceae bacterium]MBL0301962.1 toll/interleukin-1 receptor domain-containing protein [Cytophagaceae bacterium]MBL0324789.1 toll/interleukin-1 receptor domain-containing protein [Cytophagaceae bacterium]
MLDQEELYQNLLEENWETILKIIYENKNLIKSDTLLKQACKVFETQFVGKIDTLSIEKVKLVEILENLYLLHCGNFYSLEQENYKAIVLSIVKRIELKNAYNYALEFPTEMICRQIISNFNIEKIKKEGYKLESKKDLTKNWIEIFNRLFELINLQSNSATYYSGQRFISVVREFEPYFPDYAQFIELRNNEGKSTSRKVFYYDILSGVNLNLRNNILNRILTTIEPFNKEKVDEIKQLMNGKSIKTNTEDILLSNKQPNVFISYSWDSEEHKNWVLDLADSLCEEGINVILDRYYLKAGKSLTKFLETNIGAVDKVLIIFTENYKKKAEKRQGGVGFEYSILNQELYENQSESERIIPILRNGKPVDSIPTYMRQLIHLDITKDENYSVWFSELLKEIYDEPTIRKPKIGIRKTY